MSGRRPPPDLEVRILDVPTMSGSERAAIFAIFEASYRQPNHEYLQRSLDRIGTVALAMVGGRGVGYAISQTRWMDLPGFEAPQLVVLHGMRCVIPEYRHRGINGEIGRVTDAAVREQLAADGRPHERRLVCGRYGHAARAGGRDDLGSVPRLGVRPTRWQQAVGLAIADAYGSNLDPESFVCVGSGTPIGYPNEEFEPSEAEREAYAAVNRDRGDNLLVISWAPDPPSGWNDPDRAV